VNRQQTCQANACTPTIPPNWVTNFTSVMPDSVVSMQQAVATSVVSVLVDADDMQFYAGGVFTGPCGASLDHSMALVGYDTTSGTDYWFLKNSWGSAWGEGGYMLLSRTVPADQPAGLCGILAAGTYPDHSE
jgi:hypothetical protein